MILVVIYICIYYITVSLFSNNNKQLLFIKHHLGALQALYLIRTTTLQGRWYSCFTGEEKLRFKDIYWVVQYFPAVHFWNKIENLGLLTLDSLCMLLHTTLSSCEVRIQIQIKSVKFKWEGSAKGYFILSFNVNYSSSFLNCVSRNTQDTLIGM